LTLDAAAGQPASLTGGPSPADGGATASAPRALPRPGLEVEKAEPRRAVQPLANSSVTEEARPAAVLAPPAVQGMGGEATTAAPQPQAPAPFRLHLKLPTRGREGMLETTLRSASPQAAGSPHPAASPSLLQRRKQKGLKSMAISNIAVSGFAAPVAEVQSTERGRPALKTSEQQRGRSPDKLAPKVILELPSESGSSRPPRYLPGAFPLQRTVFFFDWDDTLCPTTWIRSVLKGLIDDRLEWDTNAVETMVDWHYMIPQWFRHSLPDDEFFKDMMKDLQQRAINVIKKAQEYGVVCIVTNSLPGWVDMTIKKWLPALTQYIHGHGIAYPPIKVFYSQQVQLRAPADVSWVPECDEYALMKRDAMSLALHEIEDLYRMPEEADKASGMPRSSWCSSHETKRVASVVSIGNDEAEMTGAELASFGYGTWRGCQRQDAALPSPPTPSNRGQGTGAPPPCWRSPRAFSVHRSDRQLPPGPWLKRVKFTDHPHVRDLAFHLEETAQLLPYLAGVKEHARLDLEGAELRSPEGPSTSRSAGRSARSASSRARTQPAGLGLNLRAHSLRTQTA